MTEFRVCVFVCLFFCCFVSGRNDDEGREPLFAFLLDRFCVLSFHFSRLLWRSQELPQVVRGGKGTVERDHVFGEVRPNNSSRGGRAAGSLRVDTGSFS